MNDLSFDSVIRILKENTPTLNIGREIYPELRKLKSQDGIYLWALTTNGPVFNGYPVRVVDGDEFRFSLD